MATTYSNKCAILSDLWLNYRDDEEFIDFVEYNDVGLPLAYALNTGIVESTAMAEEFVSETFAVLLAGVEIEDQGFETLDDVFVAVEDKEDKK